MHAGRGESQVDFVTIAGLALLAMPLLTMWHEIGGHAAACVAMGGKVTEIGAFYVQCSGLDYWPDIFVAAAGVLVDVGLALFAWAMWARASADLARLIWWYIAVVKGFVAAGYFAFSGVTGQGDLGPSGGFAGLGNPLAMRAFLTLAGIAAYWWLYQRAARTLATMIGQGPLTKTSRRRIGHLFYLVLGIGAVFVGLFNPVGIFITIMSAAASSFGGNAGFIWLGYGTSDVGEPVPFRIGRHWAILGLGVATSAIFGWVLGPSVRF